MIAIPAIDLRDGACVQLVGGEFDDERVRLPNPVDVAAQWRDAGFRRLHVVDLDAAVGTGSNDQVLRRLANVDGLRAGIGGGVRSTERVTELLAAGADWAVVGTRAIEDPAWLADLSLQYPSRIVVAADVRRRSVVVHGWKRQLDLDILEVIAQLEHLPLAGILVTAVHREGQLGGPDLDLVDDVARSTAHPVIASGGISAIDDLRALAARGAAACVIGMALYTGALDARAVATEFGV